MAKKTKIPGSLTKKHWFGYMFGDWGGCMTFALMTSTFSLYCTKLLGINSTVMGILTIIWTIWDAINDPMMGAYRFRFGQFHRDRFDNEVFEADGVFIHSDSADNFVKETCRRTVGIVVE